ncbi:MAG TPA: hypothetical protein VGN97_00985 [Mesorhizobium sp.]|jgi:hypothetical protein|nr:hypothetical protein [Mesorhizobium sp.]
MALASSPHVVEVEGEAVLLRPTLRCALRLARLGLPTVFRGVAEGSLSTMADVIREGSDRLTHVPALLREIEQEGAQRLDHLRAPLMAFLADLTGADERRGKPKAEAEKPKPDVLVTYEQFFVELFEFATGNLGWTPDQAWIAHPAEIAAAQRGRMALLRSIFGSGDQADEKPKGNLAQQARNAMAILGGTTVKRSDMKAAA